MKTLAVVLCTYNGERWLRELLDSIRKQTRPPDEMVINDDRSTDGTFAMAESFAAEAPFPVRVLRNERNLGATKNFEHAMTLVDTDLIAFCDQDDIWHPDKLSRAVEAFATDPSLGFTFSDAELIDERSNRIDRRLWDAVGFSPAYRTQAMQGDLLPLLVHYTFVTGSTMTFRSDLRELLVPFPQGWVHDAWIALMGTFVRSYRMFDEPLMDYRIHPQQEIGVPDEPSPTPDESWKTRWTLRARQVKYFYNVDRYRQRRRSQAELFHGVAERFSDAADRYVTRFGGRPHPKAQEVLADLIERGRHLERRGSLPDRRVKRFPIVAEELRSGRYRRFSAGLVSAAQDLLF
jgi:glycosyltransferase involved in cell wall biosynthesis